MIPNSRRSQSNRNGNSRPGSIDATHFMTNYQYRIGQKSFINPKKNYYKKIRDTSQLGSALVKG
jgi:hypothetical protein